MSSFETQLNYELPPTPITSSVLRCRKLLKHNENRETPVVIRSSMENDDDDDADLMILKRD